MARRIGVDSGGFTDICRRLDRRCPDAGGYGPPIERDPAAIVHDRAATMATAAHGHRPPGTRHSRRHKPPV